MTDHDCDDREWCALLDATHFAKLVGFTIARLLIPDGDGEAALRALVEMDVSDHSDPEGSAICTSLCEQAIREAMA